MPTVLICPPVLLDRRGEYFQTLQSAGLEIRFPKSSGGQLTEQQLLDNLDGIDATLAGSEPYTAQVIERFPRLRVISRCGVGYDAVDVAAANKSSTVIGITPGTNHDGVAEHTFALMLAAARKIVIGHENIRAGGFKRGLLRPLRGQTLGIIGFGRIGRTVAARGCDFGMNVIAYDPHVAIDAETGVTAVGLDELFASSDYISLHAPGVAETLRMIRAETIAQMKDGVILINAARGGLVDEAALAAALHSGKVAAAGLDVFANEPPVGSPLLTAPNVVLSAHLAGLDTQSLDAMAAMAAHTVVDLYQGRWPTERLANAQQLGAGWRWEA